MEDELASSPLFTGTGVSRCDCGCSRAELLTGAELVAGAVCLTLTTVGVGVIVAGVKVGAEYDGRWYGSSSSEGARLDEDDDDAIGAL